VVHIKSFVVPADGGRVPDAIMMPLFSHILNATWLGTKLHGGSF
jgi:hypothetical protein